MPCRRATNPSTRNTCIAISSIKMATALTACKQPAMLDPPQLVHVRHCMHCKLVQAGWPTHLALPQRLCTLPCSSQNCNSCTDVQHVPAGGTAKLLWTFNRRNRSLKPITEAYENTSLQDHTYPDQPTIESSVAEQTHRWAMDGHGPWTAWAMDACRMGLTQAISCTGICHSLSSTPFIVTTLQPSKHSQLPIGATKCTHRV